MACAAAGTGTLFVTHNWTVPTGNFSCGARSVVISPGVTIEISGTGSTWQMASQSQVTCGAGGGVKNTSAHGGVLRFNGVTQVEVSGCTLIGSNGGPAIPTARTQGDVVRIIGGSSHITLTNDRIQGCEFACVYVDLASFLALTYNTFSNEADTTGSTKHLHTNDCGLRDHDGLIDRLE